MCLSEALRHIAQSLLNFHIHSLAHAALVRSFTCSFTVSVSVFALNLLMFCSICLPQILTNFGTIHIHSLTHSLITSLAEVAVFGRSRRHIIVGSMYDARRHSITYTCQCFFFGVFFFIPSNKIHNV